MKNVNGRDRQKTSEREASTGREKVQWMKAMIVILMSQMENKKVKNNANDNKKIRMKHETLKWSQVKENEKVKPSIDRGDSDAFENEFFFGQAIFLSIVFESNQLKIS